MNQNQANRLKKLAGNRIIALVLPGDSLKQFIDNKDKLDKMGHCYGTINGTLLESGIADFEFLVCYSMDPDLIYYNGLRIDWGKHLTMNSLYNFLEGCKEHNVGKVVIFGADGGDPLKDYHTRDTYKFNKYYKNDKDIININDNSKYNITQVSYSEYLGEENNKKSRIEKIKKVAKKRKKNGSNTGTVPKKVD